MIIDPQAKRCGACGEIKSADAFHADRSRHDGLQYRCKACRHASYVENPDRAKEIAREWTKSNPERCLKNGRRWRASNRDHKRRANQEWREANLEKARAISRNYQHKRRLCESTGSLTSAGLVEWEAAQKKVCHWCGVKCDRYEVDHRVPLARGGKHERRNLVISCSPCNRHKGARCPVEFAQSMGKLV